MNRKVEQIAVVGMFAAFAAILSYIESLISFGFFIPGVKLGLANLAVVTVMYLYGNRNALIVNVIRIFIVGILFTNVFNILFSLAGAVFSFITMTFMKKTNIFSVLGVSVVGGVCHNIGQMLVAMVAIDSYSVIYYMPALLAAGVVTGVVIGVVSATILKYLRVILKNKE